jgi:hypothetical protein
VSVRSLARERTTKADKHVAVGKKEVLLTQRQFINYWNRGPRRANGNWRSGNWRTEKGKRNTKTGPMRYALRATRYGAGGTTWASRRAFHRLHIAVGYATGKTQSLTVPCCTG